MYIDLHIGDLSLGICRPAAFPVRHRLTTVKIRSVVEDFYGMERGDLLTKSRHRCLAHPRQLAMYFARELTNKSLPDIGKWFGGFDHTTVIHAIKAVKARIANDPDYAADVEVLRERLQA